MYWILYGCFNAFANLRKTNIGFLIFVCPSVRSSALNNLASTDNFYFSTYEYF